MAKKKAATKAAPKKRPAKPVDDGPQLEHIAVDLRGLAWPIDELKDDPENARTHDEENLQAIRASLAKYGQRKVVVVDSETMTLVAGHGTVAAARDLGWTHIAVSRQQFASDAERRAFAIADNRTAELADWDLKILAVQAAEMRDDDEMMFAELQLAKLKLEIGGNAEEDDEDDEPTGGADSPISDSYQLIIQCKDEEHQKELYDRLTGEGLSCKLLTI